MATIGKARKAKTKLKSELDPALRASVGITGSAGRHHLVVNVMTTSDLNKIPKVVDGVDVVAKVAGAARAF